MRTVTFQSVLYGVATCLGMVPGRDLNDNRAAQLVTYINDRVAEAWKFCFWPEWTVCEQRYLRDAYSATGVVDQTNERYFIAGGGYYQALQGQSPSSQPPATLVNGAYVENSAWWAKCAASYSGNDWAISGVYAVGTIVRNPVDGRFYQCITAHTAGGSFAAGNFGILTPFDKYVAWEQTGKTAMDEVRQVCRRNPRVYPKTPGKLNFSPSNHGVQLEMSAPDTVFVEFRLRPPTFTSATWSAATAYAAGALVYVRSTGECYVALQAGTNQDPTVQTDYWSKVDFPAVIASAVKRGAFADGLKDQKQTDRAVEELEEALQELEEARDRTLGGQGQFETAEVVSYGS